MGLYTFRNSDVSLSIVLTIPDEVVFAVCKELAHQHVICHIEGNQSEDEVEKLYDYVPPDADAKLTDGVGRIIEVVTDQHSMTIYRGGMKNKGVYKMNRNI